MLKELGALPIGMPATHMAESLQKGTIDGVVTDPMGIFSFKLGSLVNHYSDMFNSVISFGLVINDKSYAGLPKEYRALIDGLGTKESAVAMSKMSWSDFPKFVEYNKTMELKKVKVAPEADRRMREVAEKVVAGRIAEMEKKGLPAAKVYDEIKALAAKYSK